MNNIKLAASYILVLFLAMAIAIGYGIKLDNERETTKRLTSNIEAQNSQLAYYDSENGFLIAKSKVLEFTNSELETTNQSLEQELKNLKIKANRVTDYSKTATQTNYTITTKIRDSILFDSVQSSVFSFDNNWVSIRGMAQGDTQTLAIHSIDTLVQVVYKGKRRKPYLWFFSPRLLEQVIYSKNPNTLIVYNKTIHIVKN